jgi:phospholipid/cholesterol/gamma-HCH transport system substrate-binding protein
VYTGLAESLQSVSGILGDLEKAADFIPKQLPQIARLISDLESVLKTMEGVLIAVQNNPLLKKGVPAQPDSRTGGAGARDVSF